MHSPNDGFRELLGLSGRSPALRRTSKSSIRNPAPRQREVSSTLAPVDVGHLQPRGSRELLLRQPLCCNPIRSARGHCCDRQDMTQGVRQQEPVAPLGLLAGVVAGFLGQAGRMAGLAAQDPGRWATTVSLGGLRQGTKLGMDRSQDLVLSPRAEESVDGAVRREVLGEIGLLATRPQYVQDCIENPTAAGGRLHGHLWFWKKRFQSLPLCVGEIAFGGCPMYRSQQPLPWRDGQFTLAS